MKKLFTVTKFTFLEVYRSRLFVSLFFLMGGLLLTTYVASSFTYGAVEKIALDVGLGVMSLSNMVIAILMGVTLLSEEINQRTLYMILSCPISRSSFIVGKMLGLSFVLFVNTVALSLLSFFLYLYYGGQSIPLLAWTMSFSFFEALILMMFAVFFSLITNTTLSVLYTVVVYISGHAINEASKIWFTKASPFFSAILDVGYFIIPNFYKFNLKDYLIYNQSLKLEYLAMTQAYGVLYLGALLGLIMLVFKHKNLD